MSFFWWNHCYGVINGGPRENLNFFFLQENLFFFGGRTEGARFKLLAPNELKFLGKIKKKNLRGKVGARATAKGTA